MGLEWTLYVAVTHPSKEPREGVDLIVLASHRPEFTDVIWGSTAGHVVRHVSCAVHVQR